MFLILQLYHVFFIWVVRVSECTVFVVVKLLFDFVKLLLFFVVVLADVRLVVEFVCRWWIGG